MKPVVPKPARRKPRYRFSRTVLARTDFQVISAERDQPLEAGFQPRVDLPPYPLAPPLDWDMDPFGDRNWRFQLHAWRMLNPAWRRFLDESPDPALFDESIAMMLDWHRANILSAPASEYAWNDMAAGLRAQHLALVYTLMDEGLASLAAGQLETIDALAREHVRRLRDEAYLSDMNHAIFQLHGLRLLCAARPGIEGSEGELEETGLRMLALVRSQFGPCAVHTEDSPFYHQFAVQRFRKIRVGLYPNVADQIIAIIEAANEVTPWLTLPDGRFAAIGDTEGEGVAFKPDSSFPDAGRTATGIPVVARDLCAGGYAVLRSHPDTVPGDAFMLIVNGSSWRGSGHDHADGLGFELFSGGAPLLVDSGKYAYEGDQWRAYFLGDRAHNVAGLAGVTFQPSDTLPRGSALVGMKAMDGSWEIEGRLSRKNRLEHARVFRYTPDRELALLDEVNVAAGDQVELRFHFHEALALELVEPNQVLVRRDGQPVASLRVEHPDVVLSLHRGQEAGGILGWRSPSYRQKVACSCLLATFPPGPVRVRTVVTLAEQARALHDPRQPRGSSGDG